MIKSSQAVQFIYSYIIALGVVVNVSPALVPGWSELKVSGHQQNRGIT